MSPKDASPKEEGADADGVDPRMEQNERRVLLNPSAAIETRPRYV